MEGENLERAREFFRQIKENPRDLTLRAVYADWLDDHGFHEAASALRAASGLLDETDTSAERVAIYAANDATKGAIEEIKAAIRRETARRDAAELAQRAAAE